MGKSLILDIATALAGGVLMFGASNGGRTEGGRHGARFQLAGQRRQDL